MKEVLAASLVAATVLIAGCSNLSTTQVSNTNLTPRQVPANPNSIYLFETTFDSIRRGVDPSSVKVWVMVDTQLYPMARVPNTANRFEALVPLPPGRTNIPYKYKFEFAYPGVGTRLVNSDLSPEYRLVIPAN
ncbi:MAG TPA: hypothetical protein VMF06_12435 [Candidatus Limnocylindria bacterium]|jgi:hypothetical protein|nr:hypothetical protein [Candidatus Limnocylindria bacterium]